MKRSLTLLLMAGGLTAPFLAAWSQQNGPRSYADWKLQWLATDTSVDLVSQSLAEADRKSAGCLSSGCHENAEPMHDEATVRLGCTDCHGGNAQTNDKNRAHVAPLNPRLFASTANPEVIGADWLRESAQFVRFVNPGDLRVLDRTCGSAGCHVEESYQVRKSMMTHGGFLWGAALYNNGAYPLKDTHFGESYAWDGTPQRVRTVPAPTPEATLLKGVLPFLDPLFQYGISQPGNVLRVFERGGLRVPEIGVPDPEEEPGRPDKNLSVRGFGTGTRTDPVLLGVQKTRLHDPLLHFPGTNDQPGDYRSSGCTACHVVYANDRSPVHSGPYAAFGNRGQTENPDQTIPRGESGHPIRHRLTVSIPSSQCMVCHVHPGTNMIATYFGYTWWDNETDGERMYPENPRRLSAEQIDRLQLSNPEGAAPKGLWSDPEFLAELAPNLNPQLEHNQFADFHGHGWVFRAVYRRNRQGELLDEKGETIPWDDPEKFKKAVHLRDIHLEKGMHCIDCHFVQDVHGNGKLYNEPRAAIEIACRDCHGSIREPTSLKTSGPAAPRNGHDLTALRTPWGQRRFERRGERILQRSMVEKDVEWEVTQVHHTVTEGSAGYNPRSARAQLIRKGGEIGPATQDQPSLAHPESRMTCDACHSSWMTSCFGCHLSMRANRRKPQLHNEGLMTRNYTSYNFQVLRDDVFMLGIDGTVTGNRIAPVRSSSAVVVSSQTGNREWVYQTQQTVSSEGFSGQAFSSHIPHTIRSKEAKRCSDCHLSEEDDNNAILAQLLLQGTNFVNFLGRYAFVGQGHEGFEAVAVTERDEPQAVIGSFLHRLAYPREYQLHLDRNGKLQEAYHHSSKDTLSLQLRGEYLYTAQGPGGLVVYDVAQIDHKGFSERIVSAPVSPLGQRFYVKSSHATWVAAPSTLAVDPVRQRRPENQEQPIAPVYGYIYVTDRDEGLILVGAATLLDGDPTNNFLKRALTYNPDGLLDGARFVTLAGNHAYVTCDRGLVVLDLSEPLQPKVASIIGAPVLRSPRVMALQFRYAFVLDEEGVKVLDVTRPDSVQPLAEGTYRLEDARDIYLARTYAYVAAGPRGLVILDIERPQEPRHFLTYDAEGEINDTHAVRLAMTNASLFAYLADGNNGLRVVQLTSPESTPGSYGFSPPPTPRLIATHKTHGPAIALSEALDRDRAVDESGNQIAVFGRRGARPFTLEEMQRLYLRDGKVYRVKD